VSEAANAIAGLLTTVDIFSMVSTGSGGTLIDWDAPLRMPNGEMRNAAPMRIIVGNPIEPLPPKPEK